MATQPPRKPGPAKKAAKPAAKSGGGLMNWLGRQVGHVKKAVKTEVAKPAAKTSPAASSGPTAESAQPDDPRVVYRDDKVEEIDHPTKPGMKLRRRVIDEVIVDPNAPPAEK